LWELVDETKPEPKLSAAVPLIRGGKSVKGLSGMTCVLPAWSIAEVLNSPHLVAWRDARDAAQDIINAKNPDTSPILET
jgi:hypothetical protein